MALSLYRYITYIKKILRLRLLNALDRVFTGQEYALWGSPSIIPLVGNKVSDLSGMILMHKCAPDFGLY